MLVERSSTSFLQNAMRASIRQAQGSLHVAQKELSTGRVADVGLLLGAKLGSLLGWRQEINSIDRQSVYNNAAANTASVTQATLDAVRTQNDKLMGSIVGIRSAENGNEMLATFGDTALSNLIDTVSVSYSGQFLLSGLSPDQPPISTYSGQAPENAFDNAFQAEFGFAKDSPLAASITRPQLQNFLDVRFSDLFVEPSWSANWSNVPADNLKLRVDRETVVDVGANINEVPFRQSLKAAVAIYELGKAGINSGARQLLVDVTASELASSSKSLGEMQARIGVGQEVIGRATERLAAKKTYLEKSVTGAESVSQFEVATRINTLMTQLEASYAVTGRISNLSILNFI